MLRCGGNDIVHSSNYKNLGCKKVSSGKTECKCGRREISPTRCNNCVFILRNGFTLHVSGDNLTHHREYICCIWPQVSRLT